MRVSFAAKAVLSDLPLKQGKGGAAARGEHGQQWQNFAHAGGPGEGLRKMEGELHMDMKNPYSPAITHFAGQLPDCPNTNSQVPVSQEHTEALTAVADRAMKLLENFPREENRLWALFRLNMAGSRVATMTRTRRNLRLEPCGVDSLRCSEHFFFVGRFSRACQCSCLCTRVKGIRK